MSKKSNVKNGFILPPGFNKAELAAYEKVRANRAKLDPLYKLTAHGLQKIENFKQGRMNSKAQNVKK